MSAIAGCSPPCSRSDVQSMLAVQAHRGPAGRAVIETEAATLGVAWSRSQAFAGQTLERAQAAQDSAGSGRMARATAEMTRLSLLRDPLGVAPLYYTHGDAGALYFASEVKALLPFSREVRSLPPGTLYDGAEIRPFYRLHSEPPIAADFPSVAKDLRRRMTTAVQDCVTDEDDMACWLSGGLDSSGIAALAARTVRRLHTFAAGVCGAPDLAAARTVASFIGSQHHEIEVTFDEMLAVLPAVIYHLESFDALLVRSSIINYLAGRAAADYAPATLSGEGGDELFAGYAYLKEMPQAALTSELLDITKRLHNTALQRVDRCSAAHGLLAHVPFLGLDFVDYALRIPTELKLRDGVEKWILRQALIGLLPDKILTRTKSKFWEGAGVGDLLADYAGSRVSDRDFEAERVLPNGWQLRTKEELQYYRIFKEHFGEFANLDWMGRTKGAPQD